MGINKDGNLGGVKARVRVPNGPYTLSMEPSSRVPSENLVPVKEFSISDDVMNIADSACVVVPNLDGVNTNKFRRGMHMVIDLADSDVAGGKWVRQFTGIITKVRHYGDDSNGENIQIQAMDLGWHLTSSKVDPIQADAHGKRHWVQIKYKTFQQLLDAVIDPSWKVGINPTTGRLDQSAYFKVVAGNDLNKKLKHGRQVIIQNHKPQLGALLTFIQIEPGQTPFDLLQTYAQREGVLINVGAGGELIFFQPHYDDQPLYTIEYHGSSDEARKRNNVRGIPEMEESIDGIYTEMQCWSTVVIPPEVQNTENPNEAYRHDSYKPFDAAQLLPFKRLEIFSDPEAINKTLRLNRARFKQRVGINNSWTYNCEMPGVSQGGAFFVSDTMATVRDTVKQVSGVYYVQSTQKSMTESGTKTRLTIRQPGYLNPALNALNFGGGAKMSSKQAAALNKQLKI